jgi:hypothetical protein
MVLVQEFYSNTFYGHPIMDPPTRMTINIYFPRNENPLDTNSQLIMHTSRLDTTISSFSRNKGKDKGGHSVTQRQI